ncbi:hypothetical protein Droror1_Dr00021080 [Drosera rotundifolia]
MASQITNTKTTRHQKEPFSETTRDPKDNKIELSFPSASIYGHKFSNSPSTTNSTTHPSYFHHHRDLQPSTLPPRSASATALPHQHHRTPKPQQLLIALVSGEFRVFLELG